jgi:glycine cleavage system H lipoate-binding protein
MSPIGRVFVALNFGLSCAFLAFTAFYLQNADTYKLSFETEVTEHEKDNSNNEGQIKSLTSEKNKLAQDVLSKSSTVQELTTNLNAAKDRNQDLNKQVNALDASYKALASTTTQINGTLKDQSDLIIERTDKWLVAEKVRDKAVTERDDMQEALATVNGRLDRLKDANDALLLESKMSDEKIAQLTTTLEIAVIKVPELAKIIGDALPSVSGKVVNVNVELGTVVLNLGENQAKVSNGWTFSLYQGKKYKGECQVFDVTKNACVARVTNKVPGAVIANGDSATTRF